MSEIEEKQNAETVNAEYLAWRDEKVRDALEQSKAHPEKRVPQSEVWKKFGLES